MDLGFANDIIVDNSENVYLSGMFFGTIFFGETPITTNSGSSYIAKFTKNGLLLWVKKIENSFVSAMELDGDGNIYLTGGLNSNTMFGELSVMATANEMFLTKINPSRTFIWVQKSNNSSSAGRAITIDNNNDVFVSGEFANSITWGNISLSSTGIQNSFLVKFNSSGVVQFATRVGENNSFQISKIKTGLCRPQGCLAY